MLHPDASPLDAHSAVTAPPRRAVPAWMMSLSLHAVIALGLAWFAVVQSPHIDIELPPIPSSPFPAPSIAPNETEKEHSTTPSDVPSVDVLQPPIETTIPPIPHTPDAPDAPSTDATPSDVPNLISSDAHPDLGTISTIGVGNGPSGNPFGSRGPGKKLANLKQNDGSRLTEQAVERALRWFQRHQSPDGSWSPTIYANQCTGSTPCEAGKIHNHLSDSEGRADHGSEQIGITGLVTLCYLGAGYSHQIGPYQATVKKALGWLLSVQKADGSFRDCFTYSQAIATMALAEALAVSRDSTLRSPAQRGVNIILANRAPVGAAARAEAARMGKHIQGLAWGDWHATDADTMNTSACGWNIQALKSAHIAGLDVRDGLDSATVWLRMLWQATNARPEMHIPTDKQLDFRRFDVAKDTTTLAYWFNGTTGTTKEAPGQPHRHANLASLGVMCGLSLGFDRTDPMIQTMRNHVMTYDLPKPGQDIDNLYYTYYGTFAMFQMGDKPTWKTWNQAVSTRLVASQRRDGCRSGSWSARGNFYGSDIGPILTTALSCLTLEVYYRYERVHEKNLTASR
jgi:hypothetical protein